MQKKYLLLSLSFLCFFSTIQAKPSAEKHWYYNINQQGIAIDGYDPITYFEVGKALKGQAQYAYNYQGIAYWFTSSTHQDLFKKDPKKYLPAYGGWCTYLMGIDKKRFPPTRSKPDPENFKIIDGRLHLFGKNPGQDFKAAFEMDEANAKATLQRADAFWATRVALGQRVKELPEGMNPKARMELLEWTPFMGVWSSELSWFTDTTKQQTVDYGGKWYFHYGYQGYCILDEFIAVQEPNYAGTSYGPAIRGYDVVNESWHMTYIPVNQPVAAQWLLSARFLDDGILEGKMETQDPSGTPIIQRVRFEHKSEDYFIWSADWSYDGGKTWIENLGRAACKKIGDARPAPKGTGW